ncbi:hypothetical protein OQA88_12929 [Cercophora sp. LCS_1]
MRTVSVLVAALVAASSVAGHEREQQRKIYYPRHIKRQFTNATITSFTSSLPAESDDPSSSPSKRQSNILNSLDLDPPSVPAVPAVTTVVIQSTVYVSPGETSPATVRNGTSDPSSDPASATPTDDPTTDPESTPTARPTADPTTQLPVSEDNLTATVDPVTSDPATSDPVVSVAPAVTSSTGIVLAPTGIVTPTESTPEPAVSSEPARPLDPIESIVSNIVSVITSVLPPLQNATETPIVPDPTSVVTIPTELPSDLPGTGVSVVPSVTTDTPPPSGTGTPPESTPPPPPPSSTPIVDPPISTNTTEPPPPESTPPPTPTDTTVPPPSSTAPPPPPPSSTIITSSKVDNNTNTIPPSTLTPSPTTTGNDDSGLVTSIPHLGTVTNTQSWLPTTILVDTSSTSATGLAPTTATGIPTGLPGAIIPEKGSVPIPQDTELIQIGLLEGYNYEYVVKSNMASAQIFMELPNALAYSAGISTDKILMRKLIPLDTTASLGYITTLAIVTYPKAMIDPLRIDIKFPNSALYNNPKELTYNFTKQINPAIDITYGSYPEDVPGGNGGGTGTTPGGTGPNGDPFSNDGTGNKSSSQQGTTAGIVGGAVFVAAAYGAVMFVIARRYKKKKQAHRRASSISNPSDMQQSPRSSPALMGGALLSRDFTGYGGVTGGAAGGRNSHNSHGSGRSGMGNSARTQYISAPVAQENSLGWN